MAGLGYFVNTSAADYYPLLSGRESASNKGFAGPRLGAATAT